MHQITKKKKILGRSAFALNAQLWLSIFLILFGIHLCSGFSLNSESRSELARKFKYYHRSIRPGDRFNLVETINGTFFALHAEVELLQSSIKSKGKLETELMLSLYYNDERLILRDLYEVITIPDEFLPWIPLLEFPDNTNIKNSMHVDPRTGQISLRYKLHTLLNCQSVEWNNPFQNYYCKFEVGTNENEKIFPRIVRDLRTQTESWGVPCNIEQFPVFAIVCQYRNQWLPVIVNIYLPSFLIFSVAVFSQWKRRKLQVLVTLGGLIGLILLKTAKDRSESFTMEDLWLLSNLMHIIALLGIDLVLPARRIIRTTYSTMNEKLNSSTISNHATFSNRSTEPITTASYRDAKQRFLRPYPLSNRAYLGSSEERSVFLDMPPNKMAPVHYDLSDIEMADEDADDEDNADLQRMRTTYIHVRKPAQQNPIQTTSFTDTSPSITAFQKPIGSLSASATTVVTSPNTAILRRRTSESPASRSQHFVTKMTIGKKKKLALISIVGCYLIFLLIYIFLVIYILN